MPRYGYIRLDKNDPDIARQASQLDGIGGFDKLYVEQRHGNYSVDSIPEQLNKVINLLQPGDLLYVASLDRFCDQIKEFIERIDIILLKGADFISLDEAFDTRSNSSKGTLRMIKVLESTEKIAMSNRKKAGIRAARAQGRIIGRPPVSIPTGFREICKEWSLGNISGVEAIRKSNMKSTSFYKKALEHGYTRKK